MVKLYHTPCTYCCSKITWIPSYNTEQEVSSDSRVLKRWSIQSRKQNKSQITFHHYTKIKY